MIYSQEIRPVGGLQNFGRHNHSVVSKSAAGFLIMGEIWKDIPGYVGHYMASNIGNIKSVSHNGCELILRPWLTNSGYKQVRLFKNGMRKTFNVSVLIAMTFLGHTPCGYKIVVDHINNIKTDDRVDNLQLISARENSSKDRGGSSRYTGVSWHKRDNVWMSRIQIGDKLKHIGTYSNEYDAHIAYQEKLSEIDG